MKIIKIIFYVFLCIFIACIIYAIFLLTSVYIKNYAFDDFKPKLTTQIVDKNGKLIANIFDKEHRFYVKYDDIPPRLIEALIAVEDTSFFEHNGVNFDAIGRAVLKLFQKGYASEGASTITQQLIKNTELTPERTMQRKLKEILLAYQIELILSKEEILERYLNYIFFGHGYYGIKTAALGYFHKDLHELSLKEIAILVGLPKAPSAYDPTKKLSASLSRANFVLQRMFNIGWISEEEYRQAIAEIPIVYDETLTKNSAPYIVDEVLRQFGKQYKDLKTGGYKIELAIDLDIQNIAQEALIFGYDEIIKRDQEVDLNNLNGAMVVLDHQNGDILALVGGVDYDKSNFNRATQSTRQLGSAFKPFLYQIAMDMGYSPMSKIADVSRVFQEEDSLWKPRNLGGSFRGVVTLKEALRTSRNLATINLALDLGLDNIYNKLLDMGFENLPRDLSIVLGSFGISPLEFAKFFTMFGSLGTIKEPILVKSITNHKGELVFVAKNNDIKISEKNQTFLSLDMLVNVIENGSGRNAKIPGIKIAGKTGTTNDSKDAWFIGLSPEIEAVIWYGNDNSKPMKEFEGGARTSAPVFKVFMQKYLELFPNSKKEFDIPYGVESIIYEGNEEYFTITSPIPQYKDYLLYE